MGPGAGDLLGRLGEATVVAVARAELEDVLREGETLREADTGAGRKIRVLRFAGTVLIQEETPRGELLLRRQASEDEARRFVDQRLATYERMWDGCGCKIDYWG